MSATTTTVYVVTLYEFSETSAAVDKFVLGVFTTLEKAKKDARREMQTKSLIWTEEPRPEVYGLFWNSNWKTTNYGSRMKAHIENRELK